MKVNHKDFSCFTYTPYLDRNDKALSHKPKGCPYDLGDVVVVEETQAIGVVLGCICEDGDLRTDVDGMRAWRTPGSLRMATKTDIMNKNLRRSDKLNIALKKENT
jgi:hypothetical protein